MDIIKTFLFGCSQVTHLLYFLKPWLLRWARELQYSRKGNKRGIIKGGGGIFGQFFGESKKKCRVALSYLCNFVVDVFSKLICSTSSMFSTVFINISISLFQLGLENLRKILKDPPFITFARVNVNTTPLVVV